MKSISLAVLFFFGVSVHACPNLTGKYKCDELTSIVGFWFSVDQITSGGVTTYSFFDSFDQDTYVADGSIRASPVNSLSGEGTIQAECVGSKLKVTHTEVIKDLNLTVVEEDFYSINSDGDMFVEYKGTETYDNGHTDSYPMNYICRKE